MAIFSLLLSGCKKESEQNSTKSAIKFFTELGSFDVIGSETFSNGEIVFVGKSGDAAAILVINDKGEKVWSHVLSGSGKNYYSSVIQLSDGSYMTFGGSTSDDMGATGFDYDLMVVKYSPGGKFHSYNCIPTPSSAGFFAATLLQDGGVMAVGAFNAGNQQSLIARLDQNMNLQSFQYYYIGDWHSMALQVEEVQQGVCAIVGYRSLSGINTETKKYVTYFGYVDATDCALLGLTDYSDHHRESKLVNVLPNQIFLSTTSDGFCWATTEEELNYKVGIHWMRIDQNGQVLSQKRIYGLRNATVCGLKKLKDGNYLLTGATSAEDFRSVLSGYRSSQIVLIKLDADGNEQWRSYLGDNSQIQMALSAFESVETIAIGGMEEQNATGYHHPIFFQVNSKGELIKNAN
ncbi:MAG: hypothetical protein GC180_03730 [Bacteroidetes bacterium]|nr:hypothetical protein [Bacteroidota bacterium]